MLQFPSKFPSHSPIVFAAPPPYSTPNQGGDSKCKSRLQIRNKNVFTMSYTRYGLLGGAWHEMFAWRVWSRPWRAGI